MNMWEKRKLLFSQVKTRHGRLTFRGYAVPKYPFKKQYASNYFEMMSLKIV